MKSSLPNGQAGSTQATHGGTIAIRARFHPDKQGQVLTPKEQIINT
jgi:hypothetical protein